MQVHDIACKIVNILMIQLCYITGTVNPVLLAAATITVVCSQNEDENAKVGVRL